MVDEIVLASKIAAVKDAVDRIRAVLPSDPVAFATDRTAREIVTLNLFVAIQECVSLAAHWLADTGLDVPETYAECFRRLAERGVISPDLASGTQGLPPGRELGRGEGRLDVLEFGHDGSV